MWTPKQISISSVILLSECSKQALVRFQGEDPCGCSGSHFIVVAADYIVTSSYTAKQLVQAFGEEAASGITVKR